MTSLKIRQWCLATGAVWHDLETLVNKALVIELGKDPPNTLHKLQVHGLVIISKIDPPAGSGDDILPLLDVPGDDAPALLIVVTDPHLQDVVAAGDAELAVDLVLNREAVAVPAEAAGDVVAGHGVEAGDDVLDGAGEDVAVVRETGGEGRAVVEDVFGLILGAGELGLEGLDVGPEGEDGFLLLWEGEVLALAHFLHC